MAAQCSHCGKWRFLDDTMHVIPTSEDSYTCWGTQWHPDFPAQTGHLGLSCDDPEQVWHAPHKEDVYTERDYAAELQQVSEWVTRCIPEYDGSMDDFMASSYYEYLAATGRLLPEGAAV